MICENWLDEVAHNGLTFQDALRDASEDMGPNADLSNALAFAVAIAIDPSDLEAFIDSLRTFSAGRKSAAS